MRRVGLLCAVAVLGFTAVGLANTSHAGWPPIANLIIDKDTSGGSNVLQGAPGVHNELLGGYGSDTIYGADAGDVIWTDYHPDYSGFDPTQRYCPSLSAYIGMLTVKPLAQPDLQAVRAAYKLSNAACLAQPAVTGNPAWATPQHEVGTVRAGNGDNFIYATDATNYVWTGTGKTMVHAHEGGGVIHCQSPDVVVFLSHRSQPHYRLIGCKHISFFSVGY